MISKAVACLAQALRGRQVAREQGPCDRVRSCERHWPEGSEVNRYSANVGYEKHVRNCRLWCSIHYHPSQALRSASFMFTFSWYSLTKSMAPLKLDNGSQVGASHPSHFTLYNITTFLPT
jgi:hypothetical protein